MAEIRIVTPARVGNRGGNRQTAVRWARLLRAAGHRVAVSTQWEGERCDVLLALHARRSHGSIAQFRSANPEGALVVVLTGTDLYRDLAVSAEARRSLALATRLVVLQDEGKRALKRRYRPRTHVIYQSAPEGARRAPPARRFRVAVVGHLREEKDPFRAVEALAHLAGRAGIEVVQVGEALSAEMARAARAYAAREPRYRWVGSVPHARALAWIARSHLLVVSSAMEGGANVIAEAARIGTPVLASRISGNVGMLGRDYPGYFRFGDSAALARLIQRAADEPAFYARLARAVRARRKLFTPRAEQHALVALVRDALRAARAQVASRAKRDLVS
ncbi:MAG TPA: selenoneine biosynthesis selenosugar synthase SenB [Burkholderiales bacterium]|nr:selenoneine biosynthesis selenosugar synthase SenB [Burkholderiales bacterium]